MTTATLENPPETRLYRPTPFEAFEELQENLFGSFWPLLRRPARHYFKTVTDWAPRIDMFEKDDSLMIKADLPGLKREDIHVSLVNGDLVLKGGTKTESEVKEENCYYLERAFGSFYRRIPLPLKVKAEKIEATFKDGVLQIRISKPAIQQPEPQQITIR
ncbi:MAG TPA: Hsp20/alpha crystallin family protein [Acidobacteriota bacterium]|jgi:HSP20 family protein